jgi:hypothetical protein
MSIRLTTTIPYSNETQWKIEKKTAIEISKNIHKENLSPEEGTSQLEEKLTDYSDAGGELIALSKFVKARLNISNFNIEPTKAESWSMDSTYFIKDGKTKESLFFLKVFKSNSKNFFPEIFGLKMLREVKVLSSPKIYAIGKCFDEKKQCYFLVAESVVPGQTIQFWYNAVGFSSKNSLERQNALQNVHLGVELFGKKLARLHALQTREKKECPEWLISSLEVELDKAIGKLKCYPQDGIIIEKLLSYAKCLIKKMQHTPHYIGVSHNDVKLVHTFYDPQTNECALVDSSHLGKSLDCHGKAQGFPVIDYHNFILSLALNRFGYFLDKENQPYCLELLTAEEAVEIVKIFEHSYEMAGGILPTQEEREFLLLKHDLWFVGNCLGELTQEQKEPWPTRLKDLVAVSLSNLKKI